MIMKTDLNIKQDVIDELDWEPGVDAAGIGVIVKDGIVTLNGHVGTYAEKRTAEKAVKRVYGVRAVVDEIEVKLSGTYSRTDEDIARAALNNLKWDTSVPHESMQLKVEDGWLTLEGEVAWNYQKEAAKNAVANLSGVRGVTNLVKVKASVEPTNVKNKIRNSFERNASVDANSISVQVDGSKVTLSGNVQSWVEKKQAVRAAWSTPGVTEVQDKLQIKLREYATY